MGSFGWRDAGDYACLLHAERKIFAWEWLRRNPDYRVAAQCSSNVSSRLRAAEWGLLSFADPSLPGPEARPVWLATTAHPVLQVRAEPRTGDGTFHLARVAHFARLKVVGRTEHLLLSDGLRSLRLDVVDGSLTEGPVWLHYLLSGMQVGSELRTIQQLMHVWRFGKLSRALHPPATKARRYILMLRTLDALEEAVPQREIAAVLLNGRADARNWRAESPSLRSQAQRLVRRALHFRKHYRDLL